MTSAQMGKTIFLLLFLLLLVGVFLLPRSYIYRGAPSQSRWRDLRLWTLVLIVLYGLVYWWF